MTCSLTLSFVPAFPKDQGQVTAGKVPSMLFTRLIEYRDLGGGEGKQGQRVFNLLRKKKSPDVVFTPSVILSDQVQCTTADTTPFLPFCIHSNHLPSLCS